VACKTSGKKDKGLLKKRDIRVGRISSKKGGEKGKAFAGGWGRGGEETRHRVHTSGGNRVDSTTEKGVG